MKSKPFLSTSRAVEIYEEMIFCRREFSLDYDFLKMDFVWNELCFEGGTWKIRKYRSDPTKNFKPKAGVVQLGHRVTLSVDERLFEDAARGGCLSNFILAHEFGHVALNHHAKSPVVKNFVLAEDKQRFTIKPASLEEQEADLAAVFFQCGVSLLNVSFDAVRLAQRASTDVYQIRKARRIVLLSVFQEELARQRQHKLSLPKYPRVVL